MKLRELKARHDDLANGCRFLESKIEELESVLEKAKIDLITTNGALQECAHWIAHIEGQESEKENQFDIGV